MDYIEYWYKDTKYRMTRGYLFGSGYVEYFIDKDGNFYKMVAADQGGTRYTKEKVTVTEIKNVWETQKGYILNNYKMATEKQKKMIEEIILTIEEIIW